MTVTLSCPVDRGRGGVGGICGEEGLGLRRGRKGGAAVNPLILS